MQNSDEGFERVLGRVIGTTFLYELDDSCDFAKEVVTVLQESDFTIVFALSGQVCGLYAYIKPSSDKEIELSEISDPSLNSLDLNKFSGGELAVGKLDLSS